MGGPAPTPGYGQPPLDVGGRLWPISIGIVTKNLVGSQIVIVVSAHHPPNRVVPDGNPGPEWPQVFSRFRLPRFCLGSVHHPRTATKIRLTITKPAARDIASVKA